jgi:hypothetical protein
MKPLEIMKILHEEYRQRKVAKMKTSTITILFLFALGGVIAAVKTGNTLLLMLSSICAIVWGATAAILVIINYRRNRDRW